jgi:hypothetical protein
VGGNLLDLVLVYVLGAARVKCEFEVAFILYLLFYFLEFALGTFLVIAPPHAPASCGCADNSAFRLWCAVVMTDCVMSPWRKLGGSLLSWEYQKQNH